MRNCPVCRRTPAVVAEKRTRGLDGMVEHRRVSVLCKHRGLDGMHGHPMGPGTRIEAWGMDEDEAVRLWDSMVQRMSQDGDGRPE